MSGINLSSALLGAKSLLGCRLTVITEPELTSETNQRLIESNLCEGSDPSHGGGVRLSGYIVETEAYTQDDPACHAYKGVTNRCLPLTMAAGTIYVYFTYGMHYCLNVVTGQKGRAEAVLIRALQPIEGIDTMKRRRLQDNVLNLCSGPAKLTQALGVSTKHNNKQIGKQSNLFITPGFIPGKIIRTKRIGISAGKDLPWRFYVDDNKFISKP